MNSKQENRQEMILVVDERADTRAHLQQLLSPWWSITLAEDGDAALRSARQCRPDLILANLMLPSTPGFQMLETFRADPDLMHAPIVLLATPTDEEVAIQGLFVGADDYILTPFAPLALRARIQMAIKRARTERALRISEQRLQRMINVDGVGVLTFDQQGNLLNANDAFLKMVGYSRAAFAARRFTWQDFTPPEYVTESQRQLMRMQQTGVAGPYEKEYFHQNGSRTWMMFVAADLGDGTITEYAIDVSDRKRAEAALRESEVLLATVFKALPVGLAVINTEGKMLLSNPRMQYYLPTNMIPSRDPARRWRWKAWHADSQPVQPQDFPAARAFRGEHVVPGMDLQYTDDDDQIVWANVAAVPLTDSQGGVPSVFLIATDITESKRRETNFAFLSDIAEDFTQLGQSDQIMRVVGEKLARFLNIQRCHFAVIDESRNEYRILNYWDDPSLAPMPPVTILSESINQALLEPLRRQEIVSSNIVTNDSRIRESNTQLDVAAYVMVPFQQRDNWKYIFTVNAKTDRIWRDDQIELVKELASRLFLRLERACAEEASRASEEKYRTLFNSMDEGYSLLELLYDPQEQVTDFLYLEVNPMMERLAGLTDLTGKRMSELVPIATHWLELFGRVAATGVPEHMEWYVDALQRGFSVHASRVGGVGSHRIVVIFDDITERKRAEAALQQAHTALEQRVVERTAALAAANQALEQEIAERRKLAAQRAALVERIITAQEAERQRIARELHDTLGQSLSALGLRISMVQSREGIPPIMRDELAQLRTLIGQLDQEIDRITMELRPPVLEHLGLPDALYSFVEEWILMSHIPVDILITGLDMRRLPPVIETTSYRIVQEALTNVLKHAQATSVNVIVERRANELRVVIEDNGVGFEYSPASVSGGGRQMGVIGMTERAALAGGELIIESTLEVGTAIYLHIPLNSNMS